MTTTTLDYKNWMHQVDRIVLDGYGISVHDLGDFNSYDLFEAGVSPAEAAEQALDEDDLYGMRDF